MASRWTVVDLFCGAGGLSRGFLLAGFDLLFGIDHDEAAVATHRLNLGAHAVCRSVAEDIELPQASVIAGGPPCQGFSSAGMRRTGDSRNTLVSCFAQIVARHRPLAFVFENVEGFLTAEEGSRVVELLTPLVESGYRIHLRKVNSANYGLPQHRKRVIAVGGLGWDPPFPDPTHAAYGAPGAALAGTLLPRAPSLAEAIDSLPPAATAAPGVPPGHYYRPLSGVDLERAQKLQPGQSMRDLPRELWHDSFVRRANRRVMDGTPIERRGGAPSGVRRLKADEPCKAVTGGAIAEFIHPTEHRGLTIRECARVQSFPDDFMFVGTASQQAQQIGNAVPPLLAEVVARALRGGLEQARPRSGNGALLSFVPTLSSGRSPVLDRVSQLVRQRFQGGMRTQETFMGLTQTQRSIITKA